MATQAPLYDLVLMLSTEADEDRRAKILADIEAAIARAGGAIERNDDWGRRPMAYEIRHQPDAEYHLLQFKAPGALIEDLSHTLRITDGVTRFRVIKNRPGTPPAPSSPPPVVAAVTSTGAAPSDRSARSAEQPAPSAEEASVSAEEESAPAEAESAPAEAESAPAEAESAPAEDGPAAAEGGAAPEGEAAPGTEAAPSS